MRSAAAQIGRELLPDLILGRLWCAREKCGGLHDHAVDAVAALHRLLLDEGALQRVRSRFRAKPFESDDFTPNRRQGHYARTHRDTVNMDGAGSALTETAPKAWSVQPEIVSKDIKQRHVGVIDEDRDRFAVHIEPSSRHIAPRGSCCVGRESCSRNPSLSSTAYLGSKITIEIIAGASMRPNCAVLIESRRASNGTAGKETHDQSTSKML
jgi:hypothetical protein